MVTTEDTHMYHSVASQLINLSLCVTKSWRLIDWVDVMILLVESGWFKLTYEHVMFCFTEGKHDWILTQEYTKQIVFLCQKLLNRCTILGMWPKRVNKPFLIWSQVWRKSAEKLCVDKQRGSLSVYLPNYILSNGKMESGSVLLKIWFL